MTQFEYPGFGHGSAGLACGKSVGHAPRGSPSDTVDGDEIHIAPPKKPWFMMIPPQIPTNNGFPWFQSGAGP